MAGDTSAPTYTEIMSSDEERNGMIQPEAFLTRQEIAERCRVSPGTLANWAVAGRGPRPTRFGGCVRYSISEYEKWCADPERYEAETLAMRKSSKKRQKATNKGV